eukprot:gene25324-33855_t
MKEAIVCFYAVIDKKDTLDRFQSSIPQDERISLQLLVLLKESEDDSRYGDVLGEYSLWCIDHGFEMIEISKSNISDSYDSRDKVGLPRVMEAIESTIWRFTSSSKSTTTSQSRQEIRVSSTTETVFGFSDTTGGSSSTTTSSIVEMKSSEETSVLPTSAADRVEETPSYSSSSTLPDNEDNATLDPMDTFLSQAVRWREKVALGMDDAERREQASVLALQLSQLMGLNESDDEDDSD